MNMFCLLTGTIAAAGACIVANFQETSEITMHMLGAMLCFGVGSAYYIVHVSISLSVKCIIEDVLTLLVVHVLDNHLFLYLSAHVLS